MAEKEKSEPKQSESRSANPRPRESREARREARLNGSMYLLQSQPNARVVVANNPETQILVEILRDFDIHLSHARRASVMDYSKLKEINEACSGLVAGAAELTGTIMQTFDRVPISGVMRDWAKDRAGEMAPEDKEEAAA